MFLHLLLAKLTRHNRTRHYLDNFFACTCSSLLLIMCVQCLFASLLANLKEFIIYIDRHSDSLCGGGIGGGRGVGSCVLLSEKEEGEEEEEDVAAMFQHV